MKKKFNQELLSEELNRFKMLHEYDFYQEKKEAPEYRDLLLGDKEIDEDEAQANSEPDVDNAAGDVADELGVDKPEPSDDMDFPDEEPDEETPEPEPIPLPEPEEDDDVEVDVTSLVQGSEEAKESADKASHNSQILLQKLSDLENRLANMDSITNKIESLEKELIKRNPTPVEKLEMRSLNSYPYTQKLTDYWADKKGPYDVMNTENKPKEYILKKDDIDHDYSDSNLKKSFSLTKNDYEEEDIDDYKEEKI